MNKLSPRKYIYAKIFTIPFKTIYHCETIKNTRFFKKTLSQALRFILYKLINKIEKTSNRFKRLMFQMKP